MNISKDLEYDGKRNKESYQYCGSSKEHHIEIRKMMRIAILDEGKEEGKTWKLSQRVLPNGIILGDGAFYFPKSPIHIKSFTLDSNSEDGWYWSVSAIILPACIFLNPGRINTEKIRGNQKLIERRTRIKHRKNGFGFIKITPSLDEDFDWHHIDKNHVVATPRKLHRSIRHTLSREQSMIKINNVINQWYKTNCGFEFLPINEEAPKNSLFC